jgi:septal ring factor EnvC (AmiA/AmiB activator)
MITNEILFATQVISIVGFVIVLLSIYRVLVDSKEAANQALKENIALLKDRLAASQAESPDVLAEKLAKRVKVLEEELTRTSADMLASAEDKAAAQSNLDEVRVEVATLRRKIEIAKLELDDYLCPFCRAGLSERRFAVEMVEDDHGREHEIDHDFTQFECGYTVCDGFIESACPKSVQRSRP